jgi:phospholipase D1/2
LVKVLIHISLIIIYYIENQFFITTTDPIKDDKVKNTIGLELVNRIVKAHKNNELFKVYIVLPLLPGFEKMNTIKAVQYYNLKSIKFGEYSIYNRLKKEGILDPTEYITFHGMRNWSVLMGKLVQEIIYVHSKLMIVDDKYVICGSANINDRSLLGKRDSEIACIIKDEEFIDSKLNGKQVKVGKYAFTLRSKIFKLHIGIYEQNPSRIDIRDCASDNFFKLVKDISKHNTDIYDNVFKW